MQHVPAADARAAGAPLGKAVAAACAAAVFAAAAAVAAITAVPTTAAVGARGRDAVGEHLQLRRDAVAARAQAAVLGLQPVALRLQAVDLALELLLLLVLARDRDLRGCSMEIGLQDGVHVKGIGSPTECENTRERWGQ